MTQFEKITRKFGVGDDVTYFDDGTDGHPEKWVSGIVTEVGDETFVVQWEDFKEKGWDTEYEWAKVTIEGNRIIEHGLDNQRAKGVDADINFLKSILPSHYDVNESRKRGSIHCKSSTGIRLSSYLDASSGRTVTDAEDEEHWGYIVEAIKNRFSDRFQEIDNNTCFCHVDFTVYLKPSRTTS